LRRERSEVEIIDVGESVGHIEAYFNCRCGALYSNLPILGFADL